MILTLLYKSIIRSKLDYGSSLYGSASKTHLQKLECVQYKCLRLIIGALNSTPRPALCAETGIYPLQLRRNYITDRILIRIITNQYSGILNNIIHIINQWRFTEWRLPLICKRAKLITRLQPFMITTPSYCMSPLMYHRTLTPIPIHKLHPPSNLPNTCPQTNFVTYTDHHFPDSIHVFTDG